MSDAQKALKVTYVHEKPGVHTGNILWQGSWPMRRGVFPSGHPCAAGTGVAGSMDSQMQFGFGASIIHFRSRGYWASCFPEGDGITMRCLEGQSPEKVIADIQECFGWTIGDDKSDDPELDELEDLCAGLGFAVVADNRQKKGVRSV